MVFITLLVLLRVPSYHTGEDVVESLFLVERQILSSRYLLVQDHSLVLLIVKKEQHTLTTNLLLSSSLILTLVRSQQLDPQQIMEQSLKDLMLPLIMVMYSMFWIHILLISTRCSPSVVLLMLNIIQNFLRLVVVVITLLAPLNLLSYHIGEDVADSSSVAEKEILSSNPLLVQDLSSVLLIAKKEQHTLITSLLLNSLIMLISVQLQQLERQLIMAT